MKIAINNIAAHENIVRMQPVQIPYQAPGKPGAQKDPKMNITYKGKVTGPLTGLWVVRSRCTTWGWKARQLPKIISIKGLQEPAGYTKKSSLQGHSIP